MTRVLVVGAGIAGTGAALAADAAGARVTLLEGGPGASVLAGGALDMVPWEDAPGRGRGAAHDDANEPLGGAALAGILADLDLANVPENGAIVVTVAGIVRAARAVDRALLDLSALSAGIVFVPRADHPAWDAGAVARSWNDTRLARERGLEFVAIDATLTRFVDERYMNHADLAARHDEPGRLAWLGDRVRDALARKTTRPVGVVVPPWLGIAHARAAELSRVVGVPCGEPVVGPGGPAGLRFERARDRALSRRDIAVVTARAKEIVREGDGWRAILDRGDELTADRVVLATGGLIGGGLAYAPSASMLAGEMPARARTSFASTVDAPVTIGAAGRALGLPGSLFGESPESLAWPFAEGVPLLERAGVLTSSSGHVEHGLYAAGDLVADRPRTWLGALAQGVRAGRAAAGHA